MHYPWKQAALHLCDLETRIDSLNHQIDSDPAPLESMREDLAAAYRAYREWLAALHATIETVASGIPALPEPTAPPAPAPVPEKVAGYIPESWRHGG